MARKRELSPRAKDDLDLVGKASKGDQKAFARLMAKYKDSIYFVTLRMVHNRDDAEDLTIEAFGKAFNSIAKYNPDYAFSTWLFKIATNNAIDFIRKKRIETFSIYQPSDPDDESGTETISLKAPDLDPEEVAIKDQRMKLMREVVDQLNPKYRSLIELRYFQELSYDEIATQLDIPLGTVKAQLFRAKELLFNVLKDRKDRY